MRSFGIEIEFFGIRVLNYLLNQSRDNGIPICMVSKNGMPHRFWSLVNEPDLIDFPFGNEIVSPPIFLNDRNKKDIEIICSILKNNGAGVNFKCGLHIHYDAKDFTQQHLENLFNLYRSMEPEIDRMLCPSRSVNPRCRTLIGKTMQDIERHRDHKLNFCSLRKYRTVEFRQHQGCLDSEKIIDWVKFGLELMRRSKDGLHIHV